MGPLFDYCNKPSLGPWTCSPGTVPPTSCRYINSDAIIGVCAFSQSSLGFAAASLSYSFYLCHFPLCLYSFSLCFYLFLPLSQLLSYLSTSFFCVFILFFLLLTGLHLFGLSFNSVALPFRVSFFPSRPGILTPPLTCLFFLASSSVC